MLIFVSCLIRLFCPTPTISRIVHSKKNHAIQAATGRQGPAVANGSTVCEVCDETPTDRVVSSCCGAAFCRSCVVDMMSLENLDNQNISTRCPSCRNPFSIDLNQENQQIVDDATLTISNGSGNNKLGMPSLKEMSHVASGSILRRIDLGEFATSTKVEVRGYLQRFVHRIGGVGLRMAVSGRLSRSDLDCYLLLFFTLCCCFCDGCFRLLCKNW